MKKIHIIGGGITGCSLSYFLKDNFSISLYEKESVLGGLIHTHKTLENLLYQNIPSILHTNEKWICDLFSKAIDLKPINFKVAINPLFDFQYYDFPLTEDSINRLPWHWSEAIKMELEHVNGETANNLKQLIINFYGETTYNILYKEYFKKIYNYNGDKLDVVNWFRKHLYPVHENRNYYNEKYVVFPINEGYNNLFSFLTNEAVVYLNEEKKYSDFDADDIIILTGRIDHFFDEELEYSNISFDIDSVYSIDENKPDRMYFPNHTPYYSITNYQKFFRDEKSVIVKEYNDEEYTAGPIPRRKNFELASKIKRKYNNVYFAGRQGSYDFLDIDDCVKQATKIATDIKIKYR